MNAAKKNPLDHPCVLVVDDEEPIRKVIQQTVKRAGYECFESDGGDAALSFLDKRKIDVVITDIKMPGIGGIELLKSVKEKHETDVMIMTGFTEDFTYEEIIEAGASDFIHKPFSSNELIIRLKRVLKERALRASIIKTQTELKAYHKELIKTLVSIIEGKDTRMKGHAERVASNCVHFIRKLDLPQIALEKIYFAGLLHDIGKVYLPADTSKPSDKLTQEQSEMFQQHSEISEKILSNNYLLKDILPAIRHHHEAFDGSGYPDRLKGDKIPIMARILAIVDSYDNMTSGYPYHPRLSNKEALEEMIKNAGRLFDRALVNEFVAHMKETAAGAVETEDTADANEIKEGNEAQSVRNILMGIMKNYKTGDIALPVLPNIVQEIQVVINNPNSTVDDLARAIERDGAISIRLIAVANSPIYRGTEKFTTMREAVPRLGAREIQNIVAAIVARNLYQTTNAQFRVLLEKLWMHSLACAYGAREIAGMLQVGDVDQSFFMGLLHDIGKLPLLKSLSGAFSTHTPPDLADVLSNIQAIHSSFGGFILDRWGYSKEFVDVAKHHHDPEMCDEAEKWIIIVNLANLLAHKMGYGLFDEDIDLSKVESAEQLKISRENLSMIQGKLEKIMQESAVIF